MVNLELIDGQLYFDEDAGWEALITTEYTAEDRYRGLHNSARGETHTIPAFWNGCGWVDMGASYVKNLCKELGIDFPDHKVQPMAWTKIPDNMEWHYKVEIEERTQERPWRSEIHRRVLQEKLCAD